MTKNPSDQRRRSIEIPERTAVAISRRLPETEFETIDDYAAFALDRLLEELRRQGTDPDDRPDADGDTAEESVESRLDALGYL